MRIAVVSSTVFAVSNSGLSGYGGLEQIAWLCAKGLAALGHTVALIAPEGSECAGVTIIPTGPPGQWDERRAFMAYKGELPNYDVVIDHSWQKHAYLMKMQGGLLAPVLGVLHAPANTMYQTLPPVEKPSMVCISHDQASHFEALFGQQARVCHNGVDVNFYKAIEGVQRTDRFLFLARFSAIKGGDLAIEACLKAGVGLDLVGDTSITQEPEYFEKCKKMSEGSSPGWDSARGRQIKIVGGVSRGETVLWYSRAHALIHANKRFREPFGLAPVEAMLCGCPVVGWDNGAMRETVKDCVSGRLVRSMPELIQTISYASFPDPVWDRERAADTYRKHCREWALQFSVERMVKRYEELAAEAVETGGW